MATTVERRRRALVAAPLPPTAHSPGAIAGFRQRSSQLQMALAVF
jgi:hypothetical protein